MGKIVCIYYGKGLVHRETAGEIIDLIIYSRRNAKPASHCRNCSVPRTLKPTKCCIKLSSVTVATPVKFSVLA